MRPRRGPARRGREPSEEAEEAHQKRRQDQQNEADIDRREREGRDEAKRGMTEIHR